MKTIFASALLCCSLAAYAEPENTEVDTLPEDMDTFDLMLAAGITFGGEDLATTTDGVSVTTGGLIYLAAGGVFHVSPNFDVQASFGYHFDTVNAENGSADFTRTFIEVLPFYKTESGNRFGVGFTQVMSPEFSGPFGSGIEFDDASGMIIEYDWSISGNSTGVASNAYIGLRYVNLSYEKSGYVILMPDGSFTDSVDGSYIGLLIQGSF